MIYILCLDGIPIAAASRMERLNEHMAAYEPMKQAQMAIHCVEVLQ